VFQESGEGAFKYDIFETLLRIFVNATMYPHSAQKQQKEEDVVPGWSH
jgi:hypothetical protein